MSNYRTKVIIHVTENEFERVRAISYFGNLDLNSATILHRKNRYTNIVFIPNYLACALNYAKLRYFRNCDFIEIISKKY